MSSRGPSSAASAFSSSASAARSSPPEAVERILRGRDAAAPPLVPAPSPPPFAADTIASTSSALRIRLTAFTPRAEAISESCPRSLPSSWVRSNVSVIGCAPPDRSCGHWRPTGLVISGLPSDRALGPANRRDRAIVPSEELRPRPTAKGTAPRTEERENCGVSGPFRPLRYGWVRRPGSRRMFVTLHPRGVQPHELSALPTKRSTNRWRTLEESHRRQSAEGCDRWRRIRP